jgi:hypothetical protein
LVARVTRLVEQCIDLGHAHALGPGSNACDLIAGFYFAFLQYAEIEARSPVLDHQGGHLGLVHADAEPVASDAWLCHLE